MATDKQVKLIEQLKAKGFSIVPLPLGGYLITDLAYTPMLATECPHTAVQYLAPDNRVDLRPSPVHQYTFEV